MARKTHSKPRATGAHKTVAARTASGEGAMLLSNEPVSWIPRDPRLEGIQEAYGCFVSGDSMEPAYERGNLLLVNPSAEVSPGDARPPMARATC